MHRIELRPNSRILRASTWLLDHASNETSQFGEDGILATIFSRIGEGKRWCVEAGAADGRQWSNTFTLIRKGWSGVLIERDVDLFAQLEATHADMARIHSLHATIGFCQSSRSLDALLTDTPIPYDFDLLSLDIDGNDWHVWESLSHYRPRVVVIEFNPSVPNDVVFVQDRDDQLNHGCSLLALQELGRHKGYELVAATDVNGIFVLREEFSVFGISDNSVDAMFYPKLAGRIFQGYDGTIFTTNVRLLWKGHVEIAPDALQILPTSQRVYENPLRSGPMKRFESPSS